MLSVAITPLKMDIFNALKSKECQEAFAKALMSTVPGDCGNDPEAIEMANKYGEIAAGYLAGALATPLAEAIDKYVKSIGLMITPTALISPPTGGPVTGVITTQEVQVL